jgi:zinc/manganese transport system substrate-binding protein
VNVRSPTIISQLALTAILSVLATAAPAQARVNVVATFSILGDFARNVGGDRVEVTTLVGPNGDSHVYTPTAADAKRVADAALVIVNALGLEGWLPRLVASAGGHARIVTASERITPRKSSDDQSRDVDPHAWQSVPNAEIYVVNIRDALIAVDPDGADIYRANTERYLAKLDALDRDVSAAIGNIPESRRQVISAHNAFGYFADAYGMSFVAPQGVSTESEVSAQDLVAVIRQIKADHISAIFLENNIDPRLIQQIATETGARIGGKLYSDALTGENGEAPTYIDLIKHNIKALTGALAN